MISKHKPALRVGAALSAIWIVLLLGFWLLIPVAADTGSGGIVRLVVAIGTIMPLILIWMAVAFTLRMKELRNECETLRAELGQIASRLKSPPSSNSAPKPSSGQPAFAPTASSPPPKARAAPRPPLTPPRQPAPLPGQTSMEFETPASALVPADILVKALNFPDDADDRSAIVALRSALEEPETARVLRAAQDVVTLLASRGVFMDDLSPNHASPAIWRIFASGDRSKSSTSIGGIHDAEALELVKTLLRSDEIFRDTAHHFLRHFDTMLTRNLPSFDDTQVMALANTRSARGFMLIGRAAGVFRHSDH